MDGRLIQSARQSKSHSPLLFWIEGKNPGGYQEEAVSEAETPQWKKTKTDDAYLKSWTN